MEEQPLQHVQLFTVKGLYKEVHSDKFNNTRQHEGEGHKHFLARLQSQDMFCEFTFQCPNLSCQHVISYSEDTVAGQLITELANKEYQSKFHRLVSLETTDTSPPHLQSSLSSHLTFSSLRSEQK